MAKSKPGLLVVDAHAQAYRAYYALAQSNLTDAVTGQPTGALFGFFRMLFKLLIENRPEHTAVVWDAPGPTFRSELSADYKATRKPMPDDLRTQIAEIKTLCGQIGFANLEQPGFEADDIMGTLAARFGKKGKVLLLTADKDCYQLLNKRVSMMRSKKGVTDFISIDPDWVVGELGVACNQITDYMGLVGDSSDNIPGAKGIGPKTAVKLIQDFGTLENLYKHLEKVEPKGTRSKLESARESAFLSRELATINTTLAPILALEGETLLTPHFTSEEVAQLFRKRGFNQIYQELRRADSGDNKRGKALPAATEETKLDSSNGDYKLITEAAELQSLVDRLMQADIISVDTETDHQDPMRAQLLGVALANEPGIGYYVSLSGEAEGDPFSRRGLTLPQAVAILAPLLEADKPAKVGQNIKYDILVLRRHGLNVSGVCFDTMVASYLCNPGVRRHNLDDMVLDQLGLNTIKYEELTGTGRNRVTLAEVPPAKVADYAGEDADLTLRLHAVLSKNLHELKLEKVFHEIELPLIHVLVAMEQAGVPIDSDYFAKMGESFARQIQGLESRIHSLAKREFNINSTKELQQILFNELGLARGKKTKTGHSTDQNVLEGLRGAHPIVDNLLEHRKLIKLKNTYIDVLPGLVNPQTGRIHTSFNQTIAATGRLSSNDPNLQNIPVREEEGRAIRRGFVARKGFELLSLDYSQIELRVMAHYSQDPDLISAFAEEDLDVHARTAASLFGVEESEVTADMRSKAKVVNFAIIYGVTEFGLSRSLSVPRETARQFIDRFFQRYPGVRRYMDDTIIAARESGYVETLSGRIRQIPEITSSNRFRREGAERTAVNTPIQGTSADIIKIAMLRIFDDMRARNLQSKMILQVHDELLFDVAPGERDELLQIAKGRMENAMDLRAPLKVEYGFGANWDAAH